MGKYFGTDGFRGEANVDLTVEHAYQVGRFLGWYYGKDKKEKCKVVIGKDTRRSSYMFEYSLVAGLTASGADVYLLHVTTTPSVSYVVRTEDFDCGIMISASHNPYYDNGIKLINSKGEKMDEETILKVEDYIDGKIEVPMAVRDQIGCTVDYSAGRNRYIGYLISLATRSYKNIKVGLDCANGSSWMIAKSVFDALGAKTYVINAEPDGLNINMNAGSTHIEVLQNFGVSFFGSDFLVLGFFNCGECHETFHRAFRLEAKHQHIFSDGVDCFSDSVVIFFQLCMIIEEVVTLQVPVEALQLMIFHHEISQ